MVRIKPRYSTPGVSPYVIKDAVTGEICYRVPADCLKWPQPFRLRIVQGWFDAGTLSKQTAEAYTRYMTVTPFIVQRIGVQIIVKATPASLARMEVKTFLLADGKEQAIRLYHKEASVRSLMVYSYLTGAHIGGMPRLKLTSDHL